MSSATSLIAMPPKSALVRNPRVAVIGGGPAGAAAAIALAREGLAPLIVERDAEPRDALCGGFLSWATVARLRDLGIDPFALGAHRVTRLVLFSGRRSAEARLPAVAAGLSRSVLDAALLAGAAAAGAGVERGIAARSFEDGRMQLDDGGAVVTDRIILATGKHELRGCQRPRAQGDAAIGLRWRIRTSPALDHLLAGRIELHLFRGGYAGLIRHAGDYANLCLAVRRSRFAEASSRPETLLTALAGECPALAVRLDCAGGIEPPQAVANIPYGWRARDDDAGLYRIGDQAAVIPSLAGEGIAIALASGVAAARAVLHGEPPPAYQRRLSKRLELPFLLAGGLWHLGEHPVGAATIVGLTRLAPPLATWASGWTRLGQ